ncbi:MAG: hypothetical protein QXJ69_05505 [Desulfurococcaceae archaeon]
MAIAPDQNLYMYYLPTCSIARSAVFKSLDSKPLFTIKPMIIYIH